MPKLRLELENLTVESFDTTASEKRRGTVVGQQCTCNTQCAQQKCPGCPTCDNTCAGTCAYTCDDGTCAYTCDDASCAASCNGTCGASCGGTCGGTGTVTHACNSGPGIYCSNLDECNVH